MAIDFATLIEETKKCPSCGSDEIHAFPNGTSLYPEMGKPQYGCYNCRTVFADEAQPFVYVCDRDGNWVRK